MALIIPESLLYYAQDRNGGAVPSFNLIVPYVNSNEILCTLSDYISFNTKKR